MKNKPRIIQLFADPGHAWAKVKISVLARLDLLNKISNYSYQYGDSVYLEEDCDLPMYIKALEAEGHEVSFKMMSHANKPSRIRNYPAFKSHPKIGV